MFGVARVAETHLGASDIGHFSGSTAGRDTARLLSHITETEQLLPWTVDQREPEVTA